MKLKKLTLQGYKTFASKTDFYFDDGITAVVGPNGSGKSNVADAVRWVLGEQSYSTLRGKRTVDMIFAGSKSRARAGMAQATLTLDNSDGWLAIDYTEVEITRRAYRSGENEYLLNGQKVRLMDISDLLAKAGLAEQTYTIIGQGLIDQALSLKSEERRALFEEAAGTSQYKAKRAATLRKLAETQHNLERSNDILSEIRPRLRSLERQATRAENYQQVEKDMRHLLRIWYGFQWEVAKQKLRQRRREANTAETSWQKARSVLLKKQAEIDTLRQQAHTLQADIEVQQSARDTIREKLEAARREVIMLGERRGSLERQLAESSEDLPTLEGQFTTAREELEQAVAALEAVQTEWQAQKGTLQQFELSFQAQQAEINHWRQQISNLERALRTAQTASAQEQGMLRQLRERLAEQRGQNDAAAAGEVTALQAEGAKLEAAVVAAETAVVELRQQRQTLQQQRREAEQKLPALRRELDQTRQQVNKATNDMARLQTRVEMLDGLRHKEVEVSGSTKIVGQLSQFLTLPEAHQRPLALALEARLATLLVADRQALADLVAGSQPKRQVNAAALANVPPFRPLVAPDHPAVIGWANELVTCTAEVRPLVDWLLGTVLLVKGREGALALIDQLPIGAQAVTADGLLVEGGGLVTLAPADGQNSILTRENEWRSAQAALEKARAEVAALEAAVNERQAALREAQRNLDTLTGEERRLAGLENEAQQRVARAQRDVDRVMQQRAFLERQQERQQQEILRLEQRVAASEQLITKQQSAVVEQESGLAAAREMLAQLPVTEAQQQRQGLQQQIEATRSIVDGRRAIADSRRATLNQIEKQLARLQLRRQEWSSQLLQLDLAAAESTLSGLEKENEAVGEKLRPLQDEVRAVQMQMRQLEGEAAVAQKTTHELENQFTRAKVALSQQETQIDNLKERIKSELGIVALSYDEDQTGDTPLPLTDVVDQLPVVTELPEEIEDSIMKRRNQLRRMGVINPDAPAEYEEVRQRHDFLEQQMEDLDKTEKQLRQVIAELDDLTSRAFAETVAQVNVVFGRMFTRLFGGGAAELVLTDPDDLTISGVDIMARLPGRRPQGLALLSGGERSLTAASLIFALLKVSPTPFCVMDEVDAALDEANVTRFREVLEELSLNSQFIVITHNRGTVQAARTIYGITMGSDSASQVISIKPEEYIKQAELLH